MPRHPERCVECGQSYGHNEKCSSHVAQPRCEKCGFVKVEKFRYEEKRGVTLAVPTGEYECMSNACKEKATKDS